MMPVPVDVLTSPKPLWFHATKTLPLQGHHTEIKGVVALIAYAGTVGVGVTLLSLNGIIQIDTGAVLDYTHYTARGISALSGLGFDGASSLVVCRSPTVAQLGSVLGDLLVSPRPSELCTRKVRRDQGNVYVPDYVHILGATHENDPGLPAGES